MTKPTKLPRIPGFKNAPRLVVYAPFGPITYRVQQSFGWEDAGIKGPCKPTEAEAIKAWKRLRRQLTGKETPK